MLNHEELVKLSLKHMKESYACSRHSVLNSFTICTILFTYIHKPEIGHKQKKDGKTIYQNANSNNLGSELIGIFPSYFTDFPDFIQ